MIKIGLTIPRADKLNERLTSNGLYQNIIFFSSVILIFGLVWFINAFNFMDGINGITSIQVMSICLSLIAFF